MERAFFAKQYAVTCCMWRTDGSGLVQSEAERRFDSSLQLL